MSDDSLIEDLERYRRNNVELAMALNDMKQEINILQIQLLQQKREMQTIYDENATLKQENAQKDSQMSTWRALIVDLVTTNTKKYTEMMQNIGLVPGGNGPTIKTESSITVNRDEQTNGRSSNVQRPQRSNDYSPNRLTDLTEESLQLSQINDTKSFLSSPEINHITSRRRASVPPMTPVSPLREIQERLIVNGETKGKKSHTKVKKMDKIIDENTQINETMNTANGRSQRRAAPKNLSEPKLGTKLRRN